GEEAGDVPDAAVSLTNEAGDFQTNVLADETGMAAFYNLPQTTLTVTVSAEGYMPGVTAVPVAPATTELEVELTPGSLALVLAETANIRSGPGEVYPVVSTAVLSDTLAIISHSEDGDWLVVQMDEESTGWIAADLVELQGSLDNVLAMAAPSTPTPAPTRVVVAAPPPAAPPVLNNLLNDPSFETGVGDWRPGGFNSQFPHVYTTHDYPTFIHSGNQSIRFSGGNLHHEFSNLSSGSPLRFGAWVKMWCSTGEDRTISENPMSATAHVCMNTEGHSNNGNPGTVCSYGVSPVDTWQYISVDGVQGSGHIAYAMLIVNTPRNSHNCEVLWDDVYFGPSPVIPTATPPVLGTPVQPEPIAFNGGSTLLENMNHLRFTLDQTGGILDRMANGEAGKCSEYEGYFRQIVSSPTYHSIPGEWQGIYNEYVGAIDLAVSRTEQIFAICQNGGTGVGGNIFGLTRHGINEALNKLIPAINAANALLGG
ncbi:MAG: carboxypeptidase regulatory-like domain-containing protein, partial [Anaerolineae bacterium]